MLTPKIKILLFILVAIIFVGLVSFPAFSSNKTRWEHVTFATHSSALKFFDHSSGKIYVYAEQDGRLLNIWQLQTLGKNLTTVYDWQKQKR